MGGNPGADGNTMGIRYPRTEFVRDIRVVEDELIRSHISGQRNWEELLRTVFREKYPNQTAHMDAMVQMSMRRIKEGYVPACVMQMFHEHRAFHKHSMLK